ncbi:MAG: thioredoxin domain-containing protein [Xanthomonadales bacterium]|nr:thioredoxin domain-containing protein [Xanthomonadales bacterium]
MNRLGNETSLYLRQHADNPVKWQPWDQQALDQARLDECPILLSIGYSACHWCHVMAHESFEDEETAELMNRLFVTIKVDREERPDLDRIYQLAHQMLTGRGGGWPLTVFLDPVDHVPFFAGTYFPRERRYGMPAFPEVLETVHAWFRDNRDDISQQNKKILAALKSIQQPATRTLDQALPREAAALAETGARQILARSDPVNGGYGGGPKFPQAPTLEAVAALGEKRSDSRLHESLKFTLRQMALSGLRDHLDGGFFRYCVDADWTIPHFEKMLYDNAQLLPLYAEAARRWDDPLLEAAARGIARWLETEMAQADGGFAASIDADADGEEGGFHVWTREEVMTLLGSKRGAPFSKEYGLDLPPNFESKAWHLQRTRPGEPDAAPESFGEERAQLRNTREQRIHPTLDDKRLLSWNALLAGGYARAGRALGEAQWLDQADGIFVFVRRELWRGDGLLAVFNRGQARFEAYLDDYAFLLDALLNFLQARWNSRWLAFAIEVADAMQARFEDHENGGFYFSDEAVDVPMTRSMIFQDDATPAGNALAVRALSRLGHLLGEPGYLRSAERCLQRSLAAVGQAPAGHASMLLALHEAATPPPHLVIGGADTARGETLKAWVDRRYRVDCYLIAPAEASLPGMLGEFRSSEPVTAWLCRGTQCLPPVHTEDELKRLLDW